jgi:hypothetical protein
MSHALETSPVADKALWDAYGQGRADEREQWLARVGELLRELWQAEYLSEQQCARYLDIDLVSCRRIIQIDSEPSSDAALKDVAQARGTESQ